MSESDEELPPWWWLIVLGGESRCGELERQLKEPVSPFLPKQPAEEGGGSRK